MPSDARHALPGLVVCAGIALVATLVGSVAAVGVETALALGLGLLVGAVPGARAAATAGARLATRVALPIGITLLGARITIPQLLETGGASVIAIGLVVVTALVLGPLAARRLAVDAPRSWLITAGMAICGNSAILALSPIVRAHARDTAYAVSTITLFGLVGVVLLPVVGRLLGLPDATLGTWAGLSVNDTAQVVATGYAYSAPAGDVATIVKLTRNLAILPVLVGATWLMARGDGAPPPGGARRQWLRRAVPWFVIGFVIVAGLRSVGALDATIGGVELARLLSAAASVLILVALAGVGLSTRIGSIVEVGRRPFLLGLGLWVVILALGLVAARAVTGV